MPDDIPQQVADSMGGEPLITLYHGTNERGIASIRQEGVLRSLDFAEIAHEVECEFSLPERSVWESLHYEFSRYRQRDAPLVYCSQDVGTAESYARGGGSEAFFDAITAAYWLLFPERRDASRDERQQTWVREQLARILGEPKVLTLEVPWSAVNNDLENSPNLPYDRWLQPLGKPYNRTTVRLRAPVPAEWIVDVSPVD